jgi:hypothetical protein
MPRAQEPDLTPDAIVGQLAEPARLRAFAAVVLGASSLEAVESAAALTQKEAALALERLAGAGLVVAGEGGRLEVPPARLKEVAVKAAQRRAEAEPADDFGAGDTKRVAVLRSFVKQGRITQIPSGKAKRLVVLDWLAGRFQIGKTYPERDVNAMLAMAHDDVAALRRYLVDAGFLERRDGFYWRAGGSVELDED